MMEHSMSKTYRIAKIVSVYLLITGLGFLVSGAYYTKMISHTGTDPVLINLSGMTHFFIGMTILVNHFQWKKPLQIAVTLLGLMYTIKGVVLIVVPELGLQVNNNPAQVPAFMSIIWIIVGLAIGYFAFFGKRYEKN